MTFSILSGRSKILSIANKLKTGLMEAKLSDNAGIRHDADILDIDGYQIDSHRKLGSFSNL